MKNKRLILYRFLLRTMHNYQGWMIPRACVDGFAQALVGLWLLFSPFFSVVVKKGRKQKRVIHYSITKMLLITFLIISFGCSGIKNGEFGAKEIDPSRYAIAYNVLTDKETDNYEIFTMNMDGTEKQNISNLSGVEWTYHSYQDKLYFISDQDTCYRCYFLYETNYKGENRRKVSDIRLADSWMSSRKDGGELIVKPSAKVDSAFYIIDINGELVQRLETGLPYASDPLFINHGQQIVFRGAKKKFKKDNGYIDELYMMNEDGSSLKQLTHYPSADTTANWYSYHAGPPKLNPTEGFISYQSFQNGKYSLFAVTLDGKKQWKLTDNADAEGWHDWSPDGNWLVIELFDKDQTQFHIGLMDWKTKEMTVLTDTSFTYQQAPNIVLKD